MDVARLNFSHGTHESHARVIERIRRIGGITVLQDLCGPKVRIGRIRGGSVELAAGGTVTLVAREIEGDHKRIGVSVPELVRALRRGDTVLLSDGQIQLEVLKATGQQAQCRVVVGGTASSHKGITVPSRSLRLSPLTEKDRRDLEFGVRQGVDLVALSFVQRGADVRECRRLAGRPVIAKIEKHEALARLDEVLSEADGVMVARGDLGVEIPLERVPLEQKRIIRMSNEARKPVITATQMLRSMVCSPVPTRAEVTDVANAVLDGTDAVMLSEETAVGQYPVEAVRYMAKILSATDPLVPSRDTRHAKEESEAIAEAACEVAEEVGAAAIVVPTQSGTTARRVASCRPKCPILAFSPVPEVVRQLGVVWGVRAEQVPPFGDDPLEEIRTYARRHVRGKVVVTAGWPFREHGRTNLVVVIAV